MRAATQSAPHRFTVLGALAPGARGRRRAARRSGPPGAPRRAGGGVVRGADGKRPHAPRGLEAGRAAPRRGQAGDAERRRRRAHPVHRPRPDRRRAGLGHRGAASLAWPRGGRAGTARPPPPPADAPRDAGRGDPARALPVPPRRRRGGRPRSSASPIADAAGTDGRASRPGLPWRDPRAPGFAPGGRGARGPRRRRRRPWSGATTSWLSSGFLRGRRWAARSAGSARPRRSVWSGRGTRPSPGSRALPSPEGDD